MADMVYVTNRTNVHLPATPEVPDGAVCVLQPGLNEVPEVASKSPFMANLVKTSAPEVAVAQAEAEAAKKVAESNAQAQQVVAETQAKNLDAMTKAGEDWAKQREAAMGKGLPYDTPHPDPVTQQAIVLTSAPHVYAAAGFIGKADQPSGSAPQHAPRVTPETGDHPAAARSK